MKLFEYFIRCLTLSLKVTPKRVRYSFENVLNYEDCSSKYQVRRDYC
ncbi:MAG: hypothetical protein RL265_679 [Bacteroidota bacterium]|jgi:hypothetical protein